jgi:hypothetical protein
MEEGSGVLPFPVRTPLQNPLPVVTSWGPSIQHLGLWGTFKIQTRLVSRMRVNTHKDTETWGHRDTEWACVLDSKQTPSGMVSERSRSGPALISLLNRTCCCDTQGTGSMTARGHSWGQQSRSEALHPFPVCPPAEQPQVNLRWWLGWH